MTGQDFNSVQWMARQVLVDHADSKGSTAQSTYYHRKKAGLAGTRKQPNRDWRIDLMTDEQREAHIQECGRRMIQAYQAGDREGALYWLKAEIATIKACSPAQIARMEGCFFDMQGEADALALAGSTN